MVQKHFPEIRTERLLLRKLKKSDWKMIAYLRSDASVNKFVKRPAAQTEEKAQEFILKTNASINNGRLYYWAITKSYTDKMIGSICLWNFSDDKKTAEVGYDLSPKFQRKGIMNESLRAVLEFGFEKLELSIIEAFTHKENLSSKKLLEKNGFKLETGEIDENNSKNVIYRINKNPQLKVKL